MENALYKVSSAMKRLNVCRATIYRMAARGELVLVKISERATRVTAESIERAMRAARRKADQVSLSQPVASWLIRTL